MASSSTSAHTGLSRKTLTLYALGSLGTGGFGTLPGLVLIYYLTDTLGVAAGVAGAALALAKVWDVIIDPVIGGLSDRGHAKRGSRRRGMLIGAFAIPVFFALTFAAPQGMSPAFSATWVMAAFLLAATAFSMFQVPFIALPAELTNDYDTRTRLLTWRVVVLTIAILLFGAGGPELRGLFPDNPHLGYLVMGVVAGLVIGAGFFASSFTAPRTTPSNTVPTVNVASYYRSAVAVLRDSQAMRALLSAFTLQALATGLMLAAAQFVATWVLGREGLVTVLFAALVAPALVVAPAWQALSLRVGKERSFTYASLLFLASTLSLTGMVAAPGMWIVGPVAVAGAAYAGMQTLPLSMLADVIHHDTVTRGRDRAGIFSGVWTAFETMGMAFGATLLTVILSLTGYVERTAGQVVTQSTEAVTGIALGFSAVPALLLLVSLIVFQRYRLRRDDIARASEEVPA